MGALYKMLNLSKKDVYQKYKHLRKWNWIYYSSCHYKKKKEIWNFYYFPSNRIFDEVVVLFFLNLKQ